MNAKWDHKLIGFREWFVVSVSFLLLLTASAKIISIMQAKPFLNYPDPVFTKLSQKLVTKHALEIATFAETFVATVMFVKRKYVFAPFICFLLVSCFVCYRMLATVFAYNHPCLCLGRVLDWTGFSPLVLDNIPVAILWFMGIGSLFFLIQVCFVGEAQNKEKVNSPVCEDKAQPIIP